MLPVLITIDTEYSSGLYARGIGGDWRANFDRTIACRTDDQEAGIFYQMDVLDRHGLTGVFFVDPMPALVWGQEAVDAVVQPLLARGHDVQLHLHPEWLAFAPDNPLNGRTGQNIKDFSLEDQAVLLRLGMESLMAAGAPRPIAFRAGNYGANDDTLRALASLDLRYDSSHAPGIAGSACALSLSAGDHHPVQHPANGHGVIEVPIAAIAASGDGQRHGQITALSFAEMQAAIRYARAQDWQALVLVSHSFEMFNRDKMRVNALVMRRFERLCAWIEDEPGVETAGFPVLDACGALIPRAPAAIRPGLLPHSHWRTGRRMIEQAIANQLYG